MLSYSNLTVMKGETSNAFETPAGPFSTQHISKTLIEHFQNTQKTKQNLKFTKFYDRSLFTNLTKCVLLNIINVVDL